MKTKDLLIQARALISDEKNWTKCGSARTALGVVVAITSPEATCFCSIGAIDRCLVLANEQFNFKSRIGAMRLLRDSIPKRHIGETFHDSDFIAFNDRLSTKHSQVLEMFDLAIQRSDSQ